VRPCRRVEEDVLLGAHAVQAPGEQFPQLRHQGGGMAHGAHRAALDVLVRKIIHGDAHEGRQVFLAGLVRDEHDGSEALDPLVPVRMHRREPPERAPHRVQGVQLHARAAGAQLEIASKV